MSAGDITNLAARLKECITVESPSLTSDGLGGNTESWNEVVSCYAEVEVLFGSAREQVIAAQREARAAYRIVIRRRDEITTRMRIVWNDRTLYVQGVANTKATTEITAYEGGEA